ncbi:SDR family oxidoreductase [Paenirhodobacter populi]|uniref:SDR family oxidoreductase n=1 Tax=Paenirhodobacter populi TaxID=2306993 RepID=A0A443IN78_9RHOB|nr:SDR family oxidoreductase [Sinirhodobacter populi]RWR07038.1 SDR family oxidoreductase [Sinirhodobacter populi]
MPTILITGCSSGFGLETARHILAKGWTVIATMRTPKTDLLPASDRLTILPLDVTDPASIAAAVAAAGEIDVLVNNAGIGWLNAVEGTPISVVRDIFETNTIGTIAMIQAVLPQFRTRRAGVIINVTSSVTLKNYDLLSVYTASKAAVNALTEVMALELAPFGIRAHVVLPGQAPGTAFSANASERLTQAGGFPEPYAGMIQSVFARLGSGSDDEKTKPEDVAAAIWRIATDPTAPMRVPAGADAVALFRG